VNAFVYVEGGPSGADSKEGTIRCREGFHKLLDRSGFKGRKPRLVPLGGRGAVYDRFVTEHSMKAGSYVAMWIDSEEPTANIEATWNHLENVTTVDRWIRPPNADDDQVLFMTTCMETWIVADRDALKEHYGNEIAGLSVATAGRLRTAISLRRSETAHSRHPQLLERLFQGTAVV
jgi:hypothetical protein